MNPTFGDLGAIYDDRLRLIGKRVVNFLLVLIELFSIGLMAEAISLQQGSVDQKFHLEGVARINHSSPKTRLNALSYDIKIYTDLSSILSQITRLTDRRTDRQNSHR